MSNLNKAKPDLNTKTGTPKYSTETADHQNKNVFSFKNAFSEINYKEFACGWGAAFINITVTYPLNKVIFRQMLHGMKAGQATRMIYGEGWYFLYRGMLPPLCQKTLSLSIMFGMYEECRRPLVERGMNIYAAKSIAGIVAGTMEAILMPLERIQTLLSDSQYHKNFKNTLHTFKIIGSDYGLKEYYRGLTPILLRNGPSNAMFFILRDEVQARIPHTNSNIKNTAIEFICGASIGAFLSSLFYPFNVVKVAAQSCIGGEYKSLYTVLKEVYFERGGKLRNVYHGVQTNCTRAFFSWGVMNAAYENLKKVIY